MRSRRPDQLTAACAGATKQEVIDLLTKAGAKKPEKKPAR